MFKSCWSPSLLHEWKRFFRPHLKCEDIIQNIKGTLLGTRYFHCEGVSLNITKIGWGLVAGQIYKDLHPVAKVGWKDELLFYMVIEEP